jgi:hypothetical protein
MTSGEHADQDVPDDTEDAAPADADKESDEADARDTDAGPLERSQDAIDQGREAARDALKDTLPDEGHAKND